MSQNGYSPVDMDKVVLIGGPSRMPYVRERVAFELGIALDTDVDPMTAVAMGAAIYATGRDWASDGEAGVKTGRQTKSTGSELGLSFDYLDNKASESVKLRIRSSAASIPPGVTIEVEASNGWTSGKLPLESDLEIKRVPLPRVGPNAVQVNVFGTSGALDKQASTTLTIHRLQATSDGMPLMHNLAIKIVKGGNGAQRNVLKTIAKKGTATPTRGAESLRAARDLRAGEKAALVFELYEQADGVEDPALNLAIGSFQLNGDSLTPGQMVRKGDRVNVHWSIDENSLLHCSFELPDLGLFHTLGNMYAPTTSASNFDGDDGATLARESLQTAHAELEQLERALGSRVSNDSQDIREKLDRHSETLTLSADADTRRMITQEARFLRQEIYRLRHASSNRASILQIEIDDFTGYYTQFSAQIVDPDMHSNISRQVAYARECLLREDLEESKEAYNEARALFFNHISKQPGFWVALFENMTESRHNAADKGRHDALALKGQQAIQNDDFDTLRAVTQDMRLNMVQTTEGSTAALMAGLME